MDRTVPNTSLRECDLSHLQNEIAKVVKLKIINQKPKKKPKKKNNALIYQTLTGLSSDNQESIDKQIKEPLDEGII